MKTKNIILFVLKILAALAGFSSLTAIIIEFGFYTTAEQLEILRRIIFASIYIIVAYQLARFFFSENKKEFFLTRKVELGLAFLVLFEIIVNFFNKSLVSFFFDAIKLKNFAYAYVLLAQVFIGLELFLGFLRYNKKLLSSKINPSRLFLSSFLILILLGSLALMMPKATIGNISYIDALFTSASAVCVTGLTTINVAENFTPFGQMIIMLLIQLGGLGLLTFTTFFALFLAGGLGIKERIHLKDIFEEDNLNELSKIVVFIIASTLLIEFIGAAILFVSVPHMHTGFDRFFFSVFHSISAFCNAGFSLYKDGLYEFAIRNNTTYLLTIAILIILGGIGFPTILNILNSLRIIPSKKGKYGRISLQTKIILISILVLLIVGTIGYYYLENGNSLKEFGTAELKLIHAFFQSASYRTAGFNAVDLSLFSEPTKIFGIFLMFIGAAPGSAAGGLKVTTFFIILASIYSYLINRQNCSVYNRTIPNVIIFRAYVKFFISIILLSLAIFILTFTEKASLIDISFECVSAFGTVGLSLGLTSALSDFGKIIIICLMFIGRITPLVLLFSFIPESKQENIEYPDENISII